MMKNKFYIAIFVSCCLAFSACEEKVDVSGTCDKITESSIAGEHTLATVDGLSYTINEYKLNAGEGVFVQRTFADGQKTTEKSYKFTYLLGEYVDFNAGRYLDVTTEDNSSFKMLWRDGILFDAENAALEATAVEENMTTIIKDLPNTSWSFYEKTLWIDTTTLDSLHCYTKNVREYVVDPATGDTLKNSEGKDSIKIVEKNFVDTVYYDVYDTVGNKMTRDVKMQIKRTNNANTGTYYYDYREFNHDLTLAKDSVVDRTFHWGLKSITSAKKFVLVAVDDVKKDTVFFEISKFDKKKKTLTLEEREFKLQ